MRASAARKRRAVRQDVGAKSCLSLPEFLSSIIEQRLRWKDGAWLVIPKDA